MPKKQLTPREQQIKDRLMSDARDLVEDGGGIASRQIAALAGAVACHLAALEAVIQQRTEHLA